MKQGDYEELSLRMDSIEEEIEVLHSRIDSIEEMVRETRQMVVSLSNSHAAIVKMNELLAKKVLEGRARDA